MADGIKFIHKNGRVIPIRGAEGTGRAAGQALGKAGRKVGGALAKAHKSSRFVHGAVVGAGAAIAQRHGTLSSKHPAVKVNKKFDLAGLGLSVASGVIAAATFSHGAKGLAAGFIGSHALDAVGIGANVASVAGKGHAKARAGQAAKQEARNFVIGNAVFAAGLVASKGNRAAIGKYAGKTLAFARKALKIGAAIE